MAAAAMIPNELLVNLLLKCRNRFEHYAKNHRAKVERFEKDLQLTLPGDAQEQTKTLLDDTTTKALANESMVAEIDQLLGLDTVRSPDIFDPTVFEKIVAWAKVRDLIGPERAARQMLKMMEELGETAGAIARDDKVKTIDGIGDCVVVLTILAAQRGITLEQCVMAAWEEIKDRTGRTVDGVFIKDEPAKAS